MATKENQQSAADGPREQTETDSPTAQSIDVNNSDIKNSAKNKNNNKRKGKHKHRTQSIADKTQDVLISDQDSSDDKNNAPLTLSSPDNQNEDGHAEDEPTLVPKETEALEHNDSKPTPTDQIKPADESNGFIEDDGEPIPSGTGAVSRDCSASDLLGWSEILPKWHSKLNQRPKGLEALVKNGVPEPLRGEVWQLLSGAQQCSDLMDHYRILLTKTAPTEQIILRDVHRTYPAHENFRNTSSSSLIDSLFKVCKAYAVYDEEVGYCQGLSFLVAALLLHMPEEQAFCVFVRVMTQYGLRDLFRNNFDALYLKFYQLERLLEDNMPDLYQHFCLIGIEPFTYASQWFLTVFTAKFPLNAVFYILDIFLLDGMDTIFQIALALLKSSKQELLAHDFEGVLKYFRVQMPKLYRDQENVQQLIVASSSINLKKLPKYAKNYESLKQKERLMENPILRLQRENAKLTENNLRLEQENDDLARDLVASKIQLRSQLDILEDKTETLNRALTYSRQDCQSYLNTISDMEDERSRLQIEVNQLKEVCRRELNRAESELARDNLIISDYKKICSNMSKRLDHRLRCAEEFIADLSNSVQESPSCDREQFQKLLGDKAKEFLEKFLLEVENKTTSSEESDVTLHNDDSKGLSKERPTKSTDSRHSLFETKVVSTELDYSNRPVGALLKSALVDSRSTSSEVKIKQLTEHIDELEVELARTKLALVEAECKCQQLTHDLMTRDTGSSGDSNYQLSGLSSKLDLVRAAVTSTARKSSSPKIQTASNKSPEVSKHTAGGTLSKLNNLIAERITNISQNYQSYQQSVASNGSSSPQSITKSASAQSVSGTVNGSKPSHGNNVARVNREENHSVSDRNVNHPLDNIDHK